MCASVGIIFMKVLRGTQGQLVIFRGRRELISKHVGIPGEIGVRPRSPQMNRTIGRKGLIRTIHAKESALVHCV